MNTSSDHVITFSGRLDALVAPDMRQSIREAIAAGHRSLVLDLSDADFIDSAALAAFVEGMKNVQRRDGDLRLVQPRSNDAMRVFRLTKFDEIFVFIQPEDIGLPK